MTRVTTLFTVALLLLLCCWGDAFALDRPYDDPFRPGGEDHPWGGEQYSDNPVNPNQPQTRTYITTGLGLIDFLSLTGLHPFRFISLDESTSRDSGATVRYIGQSNTLSTGTSTMETQGNR